MPSGWLLHFAASNQQAFLGFDAEGGKTDCLHSGLRYQPKKLLHLVRRRGAMLVTQTWRSYTVSTSRLNQAVRHDRERFPRGRMFSDQEGGHGFLMISQFVAKARVHGGRRFARYAFTEQGVAMLSSVWRSSRAVQVNVAIMRNLRLVARSAWFAAKNGVAKSMRSTKRSDARFQAVFETIRQMLETPVPLKKTSDFTPRQRRQPSSRGHSKFQRK